MLVPQCKIKDSCALHSKTWKTHVMNDKVLEGHPFPSAYLLMPWCTYSMKLSFTTMHPFTSYTTLTPHSDIEGDLPAYVTSHVPYSHIYKINAMCGECTVVLQSNGCECEADKAWLSGIVVWLRVSWKISALL